MSLANPLYFKHQSNLKVSSQGNQINSGLFSSNLSKVGTSQVFYFGFYFLLWWDIQQVDQFIQFALHIPSAGAIQG